MVNNRSVDHMSLKNRLCTAYPVRTPRTDRGSLPHTYLVSLFSYFYLFLYLQLFRNTLLYMQRIVPLF